MLSTQKGMRQHGQMPNTQRAPHRIQARALLSDLVLGRKGRYERERERERVLSTAYLVVMLV